MFVAISSVIMRTTLDIDVSVLSALKRRARQRKVSLGQLASELLAPMLKSGEPHRKVARLHWHAQPMQARFDLSDKEQLYQVLDDND
jgi:hypothetical protein